MEQTGSNFRDQPATMNFHCEDDAGLLPTVNGNTNEQTNEIRTKNGEDASLSSGSDSDKMQSVTQSKVSNTQSHEMGVKDEMTIDKIVSDFIGLKALQRHVCIECGKSFLRKEGLKRHLLIHADEKPFACSLCDARFRISCNLNRHMVTHSGEKPHSCAICGKSFALKTTLTVHQKTHTGIRPFICKECGKSFIDKGGLIRHQGTHIGDKPFPCSLCGKHFRSNRNLTKHMTTHSGEKPHSCTVCGKSFAWKEDLTRHTRAVHTVDKNSCRHCGERFDQNGETHICKNLFLCVICCKSFAPKSNFMRHMRMHTGVIPHQIIQRVTPLRHKNASFFIHVLSMSRSINLPNKSALFLSLPRLSRLEILLPLAILTKFAACERLP